MQSNYWDKPLKPVLEADIEEDINDYAQRRGWWARKFVTPGNVGPPDRIFIRRARIVFMEIKRPGEEPRASQVQVMKEMREHGAEVHWCDNLQQAKEILR